jgi:hypothetical protein
VISIVVPFPGDAFVPTASEVGARRRILQWKELDLLPLEKMQQRRLYGLRQSAVSSSMGREVPKTIFQKAL